ncbi:MAG: hypothetical protein OXC95_11200, partial [Dehalococcoidia bacterium]|nr:hypothetical protein [Dehalococcoidia bacterium]
GRDAQKAIAALLRTEDEPDVDLFWEGVATNLAAKRLRLLFVADRIPGPLARVVKFLNGQMRDIEVLAVEIRRFDGPSGQTLVPRVIGRTLAARSWSGSGSRLTRASFLEGFENADARSVAARLLDVAEQSGGKIAYGTSYGLSLRVKCSAWRQPISVAWLYSRPGPGIGWMGTRDFSFGAGVFEGDSTKELQAVLHLWVEEFSADDFTAKVYKGGNRAWAVSYEDAVLHQDILVERLKQVVLKLASL